MREIRWPGSDPRSFIGWGHAQPPDYVAATLQPDVKPDDSVGVFVCRPAPHLLVEGILASGRRGLEIDELGVSRWNPAEGPGVRSSDLRAIALDRILSEAARQLRGYDGHFWRDGAPDVIVRALDAVDRRARAGRTGVVRGVERGDDYYRAFAKAYLALQASQGARHLLGDPSDPAVESPLAEALYPVLGYTLPYGTLRDHFAETKRRGYLVSRGRGVAGADPGPELTKERDQ